MPRQPRVVAVGVRHHITHRGAKRIPVFRSGADRLFYLDTLRRKARDHDLAVLGWNLMSNHVHVVAVPARALGDAHRLHAHRFNRLYRRSGHLWQNRFHSFYSCPLVPDHLYEALAYVDLNPVRPEGLPPGPAPRPYIAHNDALELLDDWLWPDIDRARDWCEFLATRPAAGDAFRCRGTPGLRRAARQSQPSKIPIPPPINYFRHSPQPYPPVVGIDSTRAAPRHPAGPGTETGVKVVQKNQSSH